jgi:signal transduction histidine kinase
VVTDPLGRIWFSLDHGISVVDPARLTISSTPPIVHLQEISADGSPIASRGSVHVPGGSRRVTVSFTGLALAAPEQVVFRYFLEGFDHSWSDTTATRQANYTNLSPRRYRFLLMAKSPNGIWSRTEAAVEFEVDPLYWQTWWFLAVCLSMCVAAVCGIYRFRLRDITRQLNLRSEERLAERSRISRELHDTLLQSFQGLVLRFQVVENTLPPGKAKEQLEQTLDLADLAIAEGRDAVRDLRSSTVVTNDLAEAVRVLAEELTTHDSTDDCAKFHLVVEGEPRHLHPILRDEIYRIAREAVRNAFCHAQASRIDAEILYGKSLLRVRITDDGRGIDTEIAKQGRTGHYGLPGMRERAIRIGAKLEVWSAPGAGTKIELNVPWIDRLPDARPQSFSLFS